jgi:hypothetical protein
MRECLLSRTGVGDVNQTERIRVTAAKGIKKRRNASISDHDRDDRHNDAHRQWLSHDTEYVGAEAWSASKET